jgi:PAS domain S-box-containing protein
VVELFEALGDFVARAHEVEHVPVALAIFALASATGLRAAQLHRASGRREPVWAVVAAVSLGMGFWSGHVAAMLGHRHDIPFGLAPGGLAASAALAVLGVGASLVVAASSGGTTGRIVGAAMAAAAASAAAHPGVPGLGGAVAGVSPIATLVGVGAGAACFFAAAGAMRRSRGFPWLAAGLLTMGLAVPHVAAIHGAALPVAPDVDGASRRDGVAFGIVAGAIGASVALMLGVLAVSGALRAASLRAHVAASIRDGLLSLDAAGRVEWANPRFIELTGFDAGSLRRESLRPLLERLTGDAAQAGSLAAQTEAGRPSSAHLRLAMPDGACRWLELSVSPVFGAGGMQGGAVIALHDVTEARRREMAVEEARAAVTAAHVRLSEAVDAMPLGIAIFDASGRLTACNGTYRALRPGMGDLLRPGARHIDILEAAAARGVGPVACEREWRIARGEEALALDQPIRDEFEAPDGAWIARVVLRTGAGDLVAIRQDVTDRRSRETALRAALGMAEVASAAKSRFISVMSHELRTPLNGVLGFASILSHEALSDRQRLCVDQIRISGESLLRILSDILDAVDIESGALTLDRAPVDLRALVEAKCARHASRARAKGLGFAASVADDAPAVVTIDRARVAQIVEALLDNAVKFTEAGMVEVRVYRAFDAALHVSVRDTGPGIDREAFGDLAEPFSQGDASETRGHGGVGLGLTLSTQLARMMGGAIMLDTAPGKGSTFTLRLPPQAWAAEPESATRGVA